jgi:N-methylhydantoinase B
MSRWIDVIAGALGRQVPETSAAAGYGSSPHLLYSGVARDGEAYGMIEILMGGIPARPAGDGMDAHSWYPQLENTPSEFQETYFPLLIEEAGIVPDSGGAGFHRGGCGVRKVFCFQEHGEVSIIDDRHASHPWGIGGGRCGGCSRKLLLHADGREQVLPGKVDFVAVMPGDRLVYETAGAGGWGDPLQRPYSRVVADVEKGFVSAAAACEHYGVVVGDLTETERLRKRRARPSVPLFDFGPRPPGYEATIDNPLIAPLGAAHAVAGRSIDVGLLDSRE